MKGLNRVTLFIFVCIASLYFIACKKVNDDTKFVSYKSYTAPGLGKYIVYKLDSTITASFGAYFVVHSYLIKDSIVAVIKDNQDRETFKIFRYQFDSLHRVWNPTNTFYLTPTANSLEYVENNLRYISLVNPVTEFNQWQGNSYISQSLYNENNFFPTWTYTYKNVGQPFSVGGFNFANTVTVEQYDSTNNRPFSATNYSSYSKAYEVYADSVGLVYKDILSWEYNSFTSISGCKLVKPKTGGGFDTTLINCDANRPLCDSFKALPNYKIISCDTSINQFVYDGYGIRQTIVSHN
ncbi:MAG: hypothetical protein ABIP30_01915 [Ferruginibacter sp.]